MCQPSGLLGSQLVRKPVVITTGRGCASPSGLKLKAEPSGSEHLRQAKKLSARHFVLLTIKQFRGPQLSVGFTPIGSNNWKLQAKPIQKSHPFFRPPSGSPRSEPATASFGSFQLCAPPRQARRKRKRASGGHGSFQLHVPPRQARRKRKRASGGHGSFQLHVPPRSTRRKHISSTSPKPQPAVAQAFHRGNWYRSLSRLLLRE